MKKIHANFNWKLSLVVVFFFPTLCWLGFWQLDRADEKREIKASFQALVNEAPIDLLLLQENQKINFRNITASGVLQDTIFLWDNQIYGGKVGFEVIQPLLLKDGKTLFVSRGWVKGGRDRNDLPQITTTKEEIQLNGYIYKPTKGFTLAEEVETSKWPKVIQSLNVENMYKALGNNDKIKNDFVLRLNQDSEFIFTANWVIINQDSSKHTAYAFQWFGMAILLLCLFIYASIKIEVDS